MRRCGPSAMRLGKNDSKRNSNDRLSNVVTNWCELKKNLPRNRMILKLDQLRSSRAVGPLLSVSIPNEERDDSLSAATWGRLAIGLWQAKPPATQAGLAFLKRAVGPLMSVSIPNEERDDSLSAATWGRLAIGLWQAKLDRTPL